MIGDWVWTYYEEGDGVFERWYQHTDPRCDIQVYLSGSASVFLDDYDDEILVVGYSSPNRCMIALEDAFR